MFETIEEANKFIEKLNKDHSALQKTHDALLNKTKKYEEMEVEHNVLLKDKANKENEKQSIELKEKFKTSKFDEKHFEKLEKLAKGLNDEELEEFLKDKENNIFKKTNGFNVNINNDEDKKKDPKPDKVDEIEDYLNKNLNPST